MPSLSSSPSLTSAQLLALDSNPLPISNLSKKLTALAEHLITKLPSAHSRRSYTHCLKGFLSSRRPLTQAGVLSYMDELRAQNKGNETCNRALVSIRKLANEAREFGFVRESDVHAIHEIKIRRSRMPRRVRMSHRLTAQHIQALLNAPDRSMVDGQRDAAMFALLFGCSLSRSEASNFTWDQYLEIEGGGREIHIEKSRVILVPEWAKKDLDIWKATQTRFMGVGIASENSSTARFYALRSVDFRGLGLRGVRLASGGTATALADPVPGAIRGKLSEAGVYGLVRKYGRRLGLGEISPRDLSVAGSRRGGMANESAGKDGEPVATVETVANNS